MRNTKEIYFRKWKMSNKNMCQMQQKDDQQDNNTQPKMNGKKKKKGGVTLYSISPNSYSPNVHSSNDKPPSFV